MKTVLLNGGLGNQTFQYIFGRAMELSTGEPVIFDDSYFCIPDNLKHSNGVSARRFQLKEVFQRDVITLSKTLPPDTWEEIISLIQNPIPGKPRSVPELLKLQFPDLVMVAETQDFQFDGPTYFTPTCIYNPQIYSSPPNTYYHGYWIAKGWLASHNDTLLKELTFTSLTEPHNLEYAKQIQAAPSVSVHIRKFSAEGYNWDVPPEFYHNAMTAFTTQLKGATYFIFSDSLSYCKSAFKELGLNLAGNNIVFVEGNEPEGLNFRDMQLMSMCNHMIIANSSFSYLAALLNPHPNKLIANPTAREI